MRAFTQHSSEEFIHVFTHTPVHTERSVAQAYNQRFRRLNLRMNSHTPTPDAGIPRDPHTFRRGSARAGRSPDSSVMFGDEGGT